MKKLIFSFIIIFIGYILYDKWTIWSIMNLSQQEIPTYEQQERRDTLLVVNKEIPLLEDPTNIVPIPNPFADNVRLVDDFYVQEELLVPLQQMFQAAEQQGIETFQVNSAYRSSASQQQLYEQQGDDYALPAGKSEHQLGLALDIGITTGKIEDTEAGDWLAEHAPTYGFILRYPEHKTAITDIEFEPWHFRYVSKPHSLIMQQEDWVLEEYIAYLQDNKSYVWEFDDGTYVIRYAEQTESIKIPENSIYTISYDNIGGVIVTAFVD